METYDSIDTLEEQKTSLVVENVRISPARLCFKNAYIGRSLEGKILFKNEGRNDVFIKVLMLNTKEVEIIPTGGKMLKPGFKIIKKLIIHDVEIHNLQFTIPMRVNNEKINYDVIVKLTCPKISYTPQSFDFGVIDEGVISSHRPLTFTNDGHSPASFHIDMAKTKGHVVLEPTKGIVQAKSKVEIKVKIIPLTIGPLSYTLVLKCDKLISIPIKAKVIIPKLDAIHPRASKQFTFIYFTPTYFGLKSSQYLMIRNYSAGDCMFTTDGEYHDEAIPLEDLHIQNPDINEFKMSPIDGVMQPQETKPFFITFSPTIRENRRKKLYYFCTLIVHKLRGRYLQKEFIGPDLYMKTPENAYSYKGSLSSIATLCSLTTTPRVPEVEASFLSDIEAQTYYKSQEFTEKDMIRIHLCGVAETPSVKIVPDELNLIMHMQETQIRVLEIENISPNLPILLRYRKVAFISLEKNIISLKAAESKQITVTIVPYKLGTIASKIVFDLLYYDLPKEDPAKVIGDISINVVIVVKCSENLLKPQINKGLGPNYIKEVGKNCEELRFNSSFDNAKAITVDVRKHLDKNCTDFVALPNERQRSLRPWRSKTANCTIFTRQARYVPPLDPAYECTKTEVNFRKKNQSYYNRYISSAPSLQKTRLIGPKDYTITPKKELLCIGLERLLPKSETKEVCQLNEFIPLSPTHMKNIFAIPQCVKSGAIAANHSLIFPLQIHNMNDFPVRLYIRSDTANIGCIRQSRYILAGYSCVKVKLVYLSGTVGYYAAVVDLIFNESMMIPVPVLINVVPKIIRLNTTRVEFPDGCTQQYIELTNDLNIAVKFHWIIRNKNFSIQPSDGCVDGGTTLQCIIYFYPEVEGPMKSITKFASGDSCPQVVSLSTTKFNRKLHLITKEINFENLTLKQPSHKFPLIRNPCDFPVGFKVDRSNLKGNWIKISPMEATLKPNSLFCLTISVMCLKCVTFQGTLKLITLNDEDKKYDLHVKGNVVYPDIRINPVVISFPKIPSSSYSVLKFTVTNQCAAQTHINFALEEYTEFKITETGNVWDESLTKTSVFLPKESKTFFMHFTPTEAMSTWFYLPIVLNDILGPPLRYDTITQLVDYYLGGDVDEYNDAKIIPTPQKLSCIKVTALSLKPIIQFSKTIIKLNVNGVTEKKTCILKIKNPQLVENVIQIQLSSSSEPFTYNIDNLTELHNGECLTVKLRPETEKELTITYEPKEGGIHRVFLPVSLQNNKIFQLHSALEIVGICQKPEINFKPRVFELTGDILDTVREKAMIQTLDDYKLYCRPLPEQVTTYALRKAIFKNHKRNCMLTLSFESEELDLKEGSEKEWINDTDYIMDVKVVNLPGETGIYQGFFEMKCTCGGLWKRFIVGAYENCYLTTYAFSETYLRGQLVEVPSVRNTSSTLVLRRKSSPEHAIVDFWHLFPLFPNNSTEFALFMDGCIYAAEMWLYTQGFFCQTYHYIPRCISDVYFVEVEDKKKRTTVKQVTIPYVDLLKNIIGPKIIEYLEIKEFPADEEEQANYLYSIYKRIMDLVKKHGGTFSYCTPECFLSYNYFEIIRKKIESEETQIKSLPEWIDNIDEFYLLAKQSWLDLILQTYKVFYLYRLPIVTNNDTPDIEPLVNFFEILPQMTFGNSNIHSSHEQVIIAWFQYHYDHAVIWNKGVMPEKVISITGECFTDGLGFAAITSVYCPYLLSHLQTMYISPQSLEEIVHNLLTVLQAWEFLNYSFSITVDELLRPNSLRILMLMAYLYDVMPSMYPNETMVFEAGLSTKVTKSLKLTNSNHYPIAYKPVLIPTNELFSLSTEKMIIPPQKSCELKITYTAKFAKTTNCTLLLSGEVPKYHYAKNKCLNLIGIPDLTYPSTVINHSSYLYEVTNFDFTIQAPYEKSTLYEVRQSMELIKTYKELESLPIYTNAARFNANRIVFTQDKFVSSETGVLELKGLIRNILANDTINYFYFLSPNTGDFMLRVDLKLLESKKSEDIFVTLPADFSENVKLYIEREKLLLKIPVSNRTLWNTVKTETCNLVDPEDVPLWEEMFDFPAGRLIAGHLYHASSYLASYLEDDNVITLVYEVTTDKNCSITLPTQITIKNEYEDGTVDIEWKPKSLMEPWPKNFTMTLRNHQFSLLRRYNIIFLSDGIENQGKISWCGENAD